MDGHLCQDWSFMLSYARLVLNLPGVPGLFDYAIPPALEGRVAAGSLVVVPFGKQHVQGVILELLDQPQVAETRPIEDVLDPEPVLMTAQRALLFWMEERFLYPASSFLSLMLPPGLERHADSEWTLHLARLQAWKGELSPGEKRLVGLLQQHQSKLRGRQIAAHFRNVDWQRAARKLLEAGILERRPILTPPAVHPKYVRTAQLSAPPEEVKEAFSTLGRTAKVRERRVAALRLLLSEGEPIHLSWIYAQTGCTLADLKFLEARGLVRFGEQEVWRDPLDALQPEMAEPAQPPMLTPDQERAWNLIQQSFQASAAERAVPPLLLHGVTGSGKTELYLRAVAESLRCGRQAIVLVPEIALTAQMVRRFLHRFPGQVGLVHSKLSEGERYDTWRRARQGRLGVVIGPRSALFLPLP
ncbi:MAG: DEAD/DEAH box helicase, partial [Anaerolineales bacterium]